MQEAKIESWATGKCDKVKLFQNVDNKSCTVCGHIRRIHGLQSGSAYAIDSGLCWLQSIAHDIFSVRKLAYKEVGE